MYDVVIIGAGFAGLTAARTILKTASTARVLVLEVSSRRGIGPASAHVPIYRPNPDSADDASLQGISVDRSISAAVGFTDTRREASCGS